MVVLALDGVRRQGVLALPAQAAVPGAPGLVRDGDALGARQPGSGRCDVLPGAAMGSRQIGADGIGAVGVRERIHAVLPGSGRGPGSLA